EKLKLERPDYTARAVDWTKDLEGKARIAPETFSFTRCCLAYPSPNQDGAWSYYPGLIYYPHPETKPGTNAHNFNALEILTSEVPNLVYGTTASVICRADAFVPF
ncbi:MAG: hypothetical protein QOI38_2254, partial [Sphingomonadales bacterium]|nr:hypothetical protein [Sphingomonadales bacterium]